MTNSAKNAIYSLVLIVSVVAVYQYRKHFGSQYFHAKGTTMGVVSYNVKYQSKDDLKEGIATLLEEFNAAMSTYVPNSEISRFNATGSCNFESPYFYPVLIKSKEVYYQTKGAFDPTVFPLVNAWGFGPDKGGVMPDSAAVDSLLNFVGFDKIEFSDASVSAKAQVGLDFSAIAKGYAVDVVAEYLEKQGVNDYMVEIGGEVRCAGLSPSEKTWVIGIEDPTKLVDERAALLKVALEKKALATSGNYRNFYEREGEKYGHTIDPTSGYPIETDVLSASVFADDCMTADALATAFMVMGREKSEALAKQLEVDYIILYTDGEKILKATSEGVGLLLLYAIDCGVSF